MRQKKHRHAWLTEASELTSAPRIVSKLSEAQPELWLCKVAFRQQPLLSRASAHVRAEKDNAPHRR